MLRCCQQTLDLSNNRLRGPLPVEWLAAAGFPRLQILQLSHNPIGGQLPAVDGPMTPALAATEGSAAAEGSGGAAVPQAQLRDIGLQNCSLKGRLPPSWGHAPKLAALTHLDLSRQADPHLLRSHRATFLPCAASRAHWNKNLLMLHFRILLTCPCAGIS